MKNKFIKIVQDTNLFLKNFIKKQKKNKINSFHELWFIFWWEKN